MYLSLSGNRALPILSLIVQQTEFELLLSIKRYLGYLSLLAQGHVMAAAMCRGTVTSVNVIINQEPPPQYRLTAWIFNTFSCSFSLHTLILSEGIIQGTVEGKRGRGRQRKFWTDISKEWAGCSICSLGKTLGTESSDWLFLLAHPSVKKATRYVHSRPVFSIYIYMQIAHRFVNLNN